MKRRALLGLLLGAICVTPVLGVSLQLKLVAGPSSGFSIPTQATAFGALTAASAGGYPVEATKTIVGASIVSGNTLEYFQISSTGMLTPTTTGAAADLGSGPYSLGIQATDGDGNLASGTVNVSVQALTYSARTTVEAQAAATAIGTGGGVTIELRSAAYTTVANFLRNRAFSSEVIVTSEEPLGAVFQQIDIRNSDNVTLDSLTVANTAEVITTLVQIRDGSDNTVVQNCLLYGAFIDPTGNYSVSKPIRPNGIGTAAPATTNITLRNNEIRGVDTGIIAAPLGALVISGNYIHDYYEDGIKIPRNPSTTTVAWNVIMGGIANPTDNSSGVAPHPDMLQFIGAGSSDWTGILVQGNVLVDIYARAASQAIFADDQPAGFYFSGKWSGNVVVNKAGGATAGIRVRQAKNIEAYANTIVTQTAFPQVASGPGLVIGDNTTSGTHVVKNNAADSISVIGSSTLVNNFPLGTAGALISYASAFVGPSFAPLTYSQVMTRFAMSPGGPLSLAGGASPVNAGAIGSGCVTWPNSVPGSNGSISPTCE